MVNRKQCELTGESGVIDQQVAKQLYSFGSLLARGYKVSFELKNRLAYASVSAFSQITINDSSIPSKHVLLSVNDGQEQCSDDVSEASPLRLNLGDVVKLSLTLPFVPSSPLTIGVSLETKPFGELTLSVTDNVQSEERTSHDIPRDKQDDFSQSIIEERRALIAKTTQSPVSYLYGEHPPLQGYAGNIENFVGFAQMPIGLAGPVHINGEHANGEFYAPMATTEGTLVASYSRGMKLLNRCGGITTTVMDDVMQRAPVFIFANAREARNFDNWVQTNFNSIKRQAESTDSFVHLRDVDSYTSNKFVFLRFNFSTGDAAGQNMVGLATHQACLWIHSKYKNIEKFYLEGNFATDKKASQINILKTRGKRVTAEATVKKECLQQIMHAKTTSIDYHARVAAVGSFMAGVNNTGLHAANGIAAMFIATGQDAANVAESSAGMLYSELKENGDLYLSITLPSLIIATHGGGTGLATQQECLRIMQCDGKESVLKLAEIMAAVVLAGEVSLASAISSFDWVTSHQEYGRNA